MMPWDKQGSLDMHFHKPHSLSANSSAVTGECSEWYSKCTPATGGGYLRSSHFAKAQAEPNLMPAAPRSQNVTGLATRQNPWSSHPRHAPLSHCTAVLPEAPSCCITRTG